MSAGTSIVKLRASKFDKSSAMTHVNDLIPLLSGQVKDGKSIAFIKVDNGSDWDLWKAAGLDILGIVSYCAKFSAYNNIEHLWSPMSKCLSSVILPSILDGDETEPRNKGERSQYF